MDTVLMREGPFATKWEADLMQAAYFLERLGALRLDAEVLRAKLYVDLQRSVNAGERTRDLRGLLRAKEAEVVTLDRLADAVLDRLLALRVHFGLPP